MAYIVVFEIRVGTLEAAEIAAGEKGAIYEVKQMPYGEQYKLIKKAVR